VNSVVGEGLRGRLTRSCRRITAVLTGGSLSGFATLHLVHLAAGVGAPTVVQFACHVVR
jgi:hypothetical protein